MKFLLAFCFIFAEYMAQAHQRSDSSVGITKVLFNISLKLMDELKRSTINSFMLSPVSILEALWPIYLGAEGNTKSQMKEVLFDGLDDHIVEEYLTTLRHSMQSTGESVQLHSVSRIFISKELQVLTRFLEKMHQMQLEGIKQADFSEPAQLIQDINTWVSKHTAGNIHSLVGFTDIQPQTQMVVVSAHYFKVPWAKAFDKSLSSEATFYASENLHRQVVMMHMKGRFMYNEDENIQIIEIPYSANKMSMYIVLPKQKYALSTIRSQLSEQKVITLCHESISTDIELFLPRFKIETMLNLVDTFRSLGMKDAFDLNANLSGISPQPLFISKIVHKSFIEVTETGTEAAASTSVIVNVRLSFGDRKVFKADHPFFFAIIREGIVLFSGHYQ